MPLLELVKARQTEPRQGTASEPAEPRQGTPGEVAKPSQARQSRDRLTNEIGYICDDRSVINHMAWLVTNLAYQINPMT